MPETKTLPYYKKAVNYDRKFFIVQAPGGTQTALACHLAKKVNKAEKLQAYLQVRFQGPILH